MATSSNDVDHPGDGPAETAFCVNAILGKRGGLAGVRDVLIRAGIPAAELEGLLNTSEGRARAFAAGLGDALLKWGTPDGWTAETVAEFERDGTFPARLREEYEKSLTMDEEAERLGREFVEECKRDMPLMHATVPLPETLRRAAQDVAQAQARAVDVTSDTSAGQARPRSSAPRRATRRTRGPTDDSSSGSGNDDPPLVANPRTAVVLARWHAHLQRRQGFRFTHSRNGIAA